MHAYDNYMQYYAIIYHFTFQLIADIKQSVCLFSQILIDYEICKYIYIYIISNSYKIISTLIYSKF